MTTFKSAIYICGLSQHGAADFLGVSIQSVKDWCRGKSSPPFGVWVMLADLFARIEDAAASAAERIAPEEMDRQMLNVVQADDGAHPLPDGSDSAAGAMSILIAIGDQNL